MEARATVNRKQKRSTGHTVIQQAQFFSNRACSPLAMLSVLFARAVNRRGAPGSQARTRYCSAAAAVGLCCFALGASARARANGEGEGEGEGARGTAILSGVLSGAGSPGAPGRRAAGPRGGARRGCPATWRSRRPPCRPCAARSRCSSRGSRRSRVSAPRSPRLMT